MRFIPIAPISLQQDFERPAQFALAHMLQDKNYSEFFRNTCKYTYCILDNGAYEGTTLRLDDLVYLAKSYGFRELALPDKLRDDAATYKMTREAIKTIFRKYPDLQTRDRVQLMIIPQGNTVVKWAICAETLIEEFRLLFPKQRFTLGIPKITSRFLGGRGRLLNAYVLPLQKKFQFDIHLLGMDENVDQLRTLASKYGKQVRSIDSARPFVWAWNYQQISPLYEPNAYVGRDPNFFNNQYTPMQKLMSEANVLTYERICLHDGILTN